MVIKPLNQVFRPTLLTAIVLVLSLNTAFSGEVYRWVDENGKVFYSDTAPPPKAKEVKKVVIYKDSVQTKAPLSKPVDVNQKNAKAPGQVASAPLTLANPITADTVKKLMPDLAKASCAIQWKAFEEASACFDPYRRGKAPRKGSGPSNTGATGSSNATTGGSNVTNGRSNVTTGGAYVTPEGMATCTEMPAPDCPKPN